MPAGFFHQFSNVVSRGAGKPATFALACGLILLWAVSGPFFGFSETWQLVVNTATTIVTFLMVFVVQHTQNRDGEAVQAKLDELILALKRADNRLIGAEDLTGHELHKLRRMIAERVERDKGTIDEIDRRTQDQDGADSNAGQDNSQIKATNRPFQYFSVTNRVKGEQEK
jgi:low affinity Fe/Cu permease